MPKEGGQAHPWIDRWMHMCAHLCGPAACWETYPYVWCVHVPRTSSTLGAADDPTDTALMMRRFSVILVVFVVTVLLAPLLGPEFIRLCEGGGLRLQLGDFFRTKASAVMRDLNLSLHAGLAINRRDLEQSVCVDLEGNVNLGLTLLSPFDPAYCELAEQVVPITILSLPLVYRDID
mmetsp:Transcript_10684/g.20483  ORF Transcript_10684/g.20483 Transcript_10684/m.20483 type:complete len:177 (+) Transcript_10684:340-870(+)